MKLKPKVWSHIFFLIPFILALYYHIFILAALVLASMTFSTLYHQSDEKGWGVPDRIFAYIVIAYNLYLCYAAGFKEPYFLIAWLFVGIGFYFLFWKKRDDYEWHISCAIITTLCILSFGI